MTRRKIVTGVAAASLASQSATAQTSPSSAVHVLRRYALRNGADNQATLLAEFFQTSLHPALERAGAQGLGYFAASLAPGSPFYLTLESYPSLAEMEKAQAKLLADTAYQKQLDTFHAKPGLRYLRFETSVLKGFAGFPKVVAPPIVDGKPGRLFELRCYESNSTSSLREKVKMFNEGEIAIFQKTGLEPVFFGEMLIGPRQPCLVYLLSFDDLTAREANWKKFVSHPEWQKLRVTPGWSDAEIVSNISTEFLRPLPFSPIR